MKYYLAYGSNLNVNTMYRRCPDAEIAGTATIKDYRLLFKGSKTGSFLTIEPCKGMTVPVGVWSVSDYDERMLDQYEGFPTFYYKKTMRLTMTDENGKRKRIDAFAYIMHENRLPGIPSNLYMRICAEGYRDFGFDRQVLDEALEYTRKEVA